MGLCDQGEELVVVVRTRSVELGIPFLVEEGLGWDHYFRAQVLQAQGT